MTIWLAVDGSGRLVGFVSNTVNWHCPLNLLSLPSNSEDKLPAAGNHPYIQRVTTNNIVENYFSSDSVEQFVM